MAVTELERRDGMREALRWFASARRWIDEQHFAVCSIPAPTFFEQRRAEFVRDALIELGWEAAVDRAGNVAARLPGAMRGGAGKALANAPLIALTAHLDTALAPQGPGEVRADAQRRLTGPGVSDNGAGLAALLAIARAVMEFHPFGAAEANLVLVANVGEEGEGDLSGMRYRRTQSPLAARLRAVLVLDGPATSHITSEAPWPPGATRSRCTARAAIAGATTASPIRFTPWRGRSRCSSRATRRPPRRWKGAARSTSA